MFQQVKPKKGRRWSFGKSIHQPTTLDSMEKKDEDTPKKELYTPLESPGASQIGNESPVRTVKTLSMYNSASHLAAIKIQTAFRAYLVLNS